MGCRDFSRHAQFFERSKLCDGLHGGERGEGEGHVAHHCAPPRPPPSEVILFHSTRTIRLRVAHVVVKLGSLWDGPLRIKVLSIGKKCMVIRNKTLLGKRRDKLANEGRLGL